MNHKIVHQHLKFLHYQPNLKYRLHLMFQKNLLNLTNLQNQMNLNFHLYLTNLQNLQNQMNRQYHRHLYLQF